MSKEELNIMSDKYDQDKEILFYALKQLELEIKECNDNKQWDHVDELQTKYSYWKQSMANNNCKAPSLKGLIEGRIRELETHKELWQYEPTFMYGIDSQIKGIKWVLEQMGCKDDKI